MFKIMLILRNYVDFKRLNSGKLKNNSIYVQQIWKLKSRSFVDFRIEHFRKLLYFKKHQF